MWLYPIVKKFVKKGDKLYPLGEEVTKKGDNAYKVKKDYAKVESFPPADYFSWEDTAITGFSEKGQAVCEELLGVVFPTSCTEIKAQAFVNSKGFSKFNRIVITENIKSIGTAVFNGVTSLKRVYITEQGEELSLGDAVFSGSSVESFNISKRITELGNTVFAGCGNLKTITSSERKKDLIIKGVVCAGCVNLETAEIKGIVNQKGNTNPIFIACTKLKSIIVNINDSSNFTNALASNCNSIEEITINGDMAETTKLINGCQTSNDGFVLTVNGNWNNIGDYSCAGASIKKLVINGEINVIGEWSFANCTKLTEYKIPETVTKIKDGAFAGCENLVVYVPKTAEIIGERTFENVKEVIYY